MQYMLMPLEMHFDGGLGATGDASLRYPPAIRTFLSISYAGMLLSST